MIKGKTKTGFKFEISEKLGNDFRLTLALADMDSDDGSRNLQGAVNVVRLILGKQESAFYAHIAEDDGTVPQDKLWSEITDMLNAAGKTGKKS